MINRDDQPQKNNKKQSQNKSDKNHNPTAYNKKINTRRNNKHNLGHRKAWQCSQITMPRSPTSLMGMSVSDGGGVPRKARKDGRFHRTMRGAKAYVPLLTLQKKNIPFHSTKINHLARCNAACPTRQQNNNNNNHHHQRMHRHKKEKKHRMYERTMKKTLTNI